MISCAGANHGCWSGSSSHATPVLDARLQDQHEIRVNSCSCPITWTRCSTSPKSKPRWRSRITWATSAAGAGATYGFDRGEGGDGDRWFSRLESHRPPASVPRRVCRLQSLAGPSAKETRQRLPLRAGPPTQRPHGLVEPSLGGMSECSCQPCTNDVHRKPHFALSGRSK